MQAAVAAVAAAAAAAAARVRRQAKTANETKRSEIQSTATSADTMATHCAGNELRGGRGAAKKKA